MSSYFALRLVTAILQQGVSSSAVWQLEIVLFPQPC